MWLCRCLFLSYIRADVEFDNDIDIDIDDNINIDNNVEIDVESGFR